MTPTVENLWRTFRKGDRVKIVHFPYEFSGREYTMHDETRAAYQHLIESQEELIVSEIDDDGYPWVRFTMEANDGVTHYHGLMLNHDGVILLEKVR